LCGTFANVRIGGNVIIIKVAADVTAYRARFICCEGETQQTGNYRHSFQLKTKQINIQCGMVIFTIAGHYLVSNKTRPYLVISTVQ
jgi:hypothetical protein